MPWITQCAIHLQLAVWIMKISNLALTVALAGTSKGMQAPSAPALLPKKAKTFFLRIPEFAVFCIAYIRLTLWFCFFPNSRSC